MVWAREMPAGSATNSTARVIASLTHQVLVRPEHQSVSASNNEQGQTVSSLSPQFLGRAPSGGCRASVVEVPAPRRHSATKRCAGAVNHCTVTCQRAGASCKHE